MSKTMQQFCNRRQQENVKQLKEDYVIDMFVCRKLQVNILSTWTCLQQMNSVFYFSCKSSFHAVSNFRFWLKKKKRSTKTRLVILMCSSVLFLFVIYLLNMTKLSRISLMATRLIFFLHQLSTKRRDTNDKKADNF